MERRLAAILAADVVGYSRLMEKDDAGTLTALKSHRKEVIDPKVAEHRGRVVKLMGDGELVEFASAVDAVECAVEVQKGLSTRNESVSEDKRIEFRIGVNLGDVIVEGDDIYGDGVNIAARLEALANPGGICISDDVMRQIRGKLHIEFADDGAHEVKNIVQPVHVWRWWPPERAGSLPRELAAKFPPLPDKPSIAVLPFDNMSGDPEQEYFADGIVEDITMALSKLSQLMVIARNSSFFYKGKSLKVQDIARELGVRYVVEGSVRKSGQRVRISSQLIDCKTGGHLWAERFDRELTDIFAVQDEVTREIVAAMAVKLSAHDQRRLGSVGTRNVDAYDHFLRGREFFWAQTKEGNARAKAFFERAKNLDPRFAPPYAFLGFAHMMDYINGWESPKHSLERAHESAKRGVELENDYPWSRVALGNVYLWKRQHDRAIAEYETAIAQSPSFALGHMGLGWVLHYVGRSEETIELIRRGMRLDPHYPDVRLHWLAQAYYQLGRYDEAIEVLQRRLIRKPDSDISRVLLAACYGQLNRTKDAKAEWDEAHRINPDYSLERRRLIMPYKNPADFEAVVEGLRKAGLTE
jgi:adenylate cyclase